MRYVVVGSGGREHALGWKLACEPGSEVVFLPGNAGTAAVGMNVDVSPTDLDAVCSSVPALAPDLVIVGPEDPLAMGVVDRLSGLGITVFGPTAACARLESSKVFAKNLMSEHSIPTASYEVFDSAKAAHAYVDKVRKPLVVKADGLAKGKGSIVAANRSDAHKAIKTIMEERVFGAAGDMVIVEERLKGEEASVMAVTDGECFVILPPAQDHKPVYDGDRGPNTGGMGAYCPAPVVNETLLNHLQDTVFDRLLKGLRREGLTYRGVIYAGLMISSNGAHVIEFNARFGDPETQCMMPVVEADLGDLLLDAARGKIRKSGVLKSAGWGVSVVLASGGYPGPYETGKRIEGLDRAEREEGVVVFHAGTKRNGNGGVVTSGGRVLAVTGRGRTLRAARRKAYNAVRHIRFDGMHMRTDIGTKGLARMQKAGVM
jgi:phosphoribosylamine--glycine ligase